MKNAHPEFDPQVRDARNTRSGLLISLHLGCTTFIFRPTSVLPSRKAQYQITNDLLTDGVIRNVLVTLIVHVSIYQCYTYARPWASKFSEIQTIPVDCWKNYFRRLYFGLHICRKFSRICKTLFKWYQYLKGYHFKYLSQVKCMHACMCACTVCIY